jgi:hypothetical protein
VVGVEGLVLGEGNCHSWAAWLKWVCLVVHDIVHFRFVGVFLVEVVKGEHGFGQSLMVDVEGGLVRHTWPDLI